MSTTSTNFSSEKGSSFTVRVLFSQYIQYWYLFIVSVILTLASAYWYLRYTIPVYQVNAVLLIKDNPKGAGDEILKEDASQTPKSVENEIELLRSSSLMEQAVDDLALTVGYFKQMSFGSDRDMYNRCPITVYTDKLAPIAYSSPVFINIQNKQQYELQDGEGNSLGTYRFNQSVKSKFGTFQVVFVDSLYQSDDNVIKVQFFKREQVAKRYKSTLKIALLNPNSTVLKLTLEDNLPDRGKQVLSKLLEAYQYSALADKNLEATKTIKFIDERLRLITSELNDVEQHVESYKRAENITDLSQEGNMFLTGVNANDSKISDVDVQLNVLNGVENYLKNSKTGLAPASLNDPLLSDLLRKLGELQIQQEKIFPKHAACKSLFKRVEHTNC